MMRVLSRRRGTQQKAWIDRNLSRKLDRIGVCQPVCINTMCPNWGTFCLLVSFHVLDRGAVNKQFKLRWHSCYTHVCSAASASSESPCLLAHILKKRLGGSAPLRILCPSGSVLRHLTMSSGAASRLEVLNRHFGAQNIDTDISVVRQDTKARGGLPASQVMTRLRLRLL